MKYVGNIVGMVLLAWFLNEILKTDETSTIVVTDILSTEKTPDYFSENIQIKQFNGQGKLQSLIEAERLTHFPDEDFAQLFAPKLVLYRHNSDVTTIKALSGKIDDKSGDLTMSGKVLLSTLDNYQHQKLLIKTSSLHYNVVEQLIWSDETISAKLTLSRLSAKGFRFDLQKELLILEEKVNIYYDLSF